MHSTYQFNTENPTMLFSAKSLQAILLLACGPSLVACSWHGYIAPAEDDFDQVSQRADAYELGAQNFNPDDETQAARLDATTRALSDVQLIFEGERFAQLMGNKNWAAACDQQPIVQVSGEEVVQDLKNLNVRVSIFPKKPFRAIGLTDTENNRIAIDPARMDGNTGDEIIAASQLIETVAHEVTHLVTSTSGGVKYRDRGHGRVGCTKGDLVSYRVGRAVQAIWISEQVALR